MSVQNQATIQRYIRILDERYKKLRTSLEGSEATRDYARIAGQDPDEFIKKNVVISDLDVRLAADDFNNILKEIKKLK